jgi:hypothetical protein
MKTTISTRLILLVCLLSVVWTTSEAARPDVTKKKEFSESFKVSGGDELSIDNRYGSITITTWNKKEVAFRVVVTSKARKESDAQKQIDRVNVSLRKTGGTVYGETTLDNVRGNNSGYSLSIDYYVSMPSNLATTLAQKYGDINIPSDLDEACTIELKYGTLQAADFAKHLTLEAKYSTFIIGNAPSVTMEIGYCSGSKIKNVSGDLTIDSKYSDLKAGKIGKLHLEDKYSNFDIDEVGYMAVDSKYSKFTIRSLRERLNGEFGYCQLSVKALSAGFSNVSMDCRYSDVNIKVSEQAAFRFEASDLKYGSASVRLKKESNVRESDDSYRCSVNGGGNAVIQFDAHDYSNITLGNI